MTTGNAVEELVDRFALVGTVLDGKFRIDRLVAEGGFGVVYQGTHLTLERQVAVKVLKTPPEFNDAARSAFIEKFALEAKTIARVTHSAIVQVLDFGVSAMPIGERAPWMVLEWLTGQTLEAALEARRGQGGRTPAEALAMMRPIFEALAYAHEEGVAHRDIKPANIMVVQGRRGVALRLMDFGIAKLMDQGESAGTGATRTRTVMSAFSPQYAAPEQISGTRTGPWTDVHALALILSEVLTDVAPYEGDDLTQLFAEVLAPVRPTPARRGLDAGGWEPVLAKGLALKPDDRYRNAGEFLAALEGSLASATHTGRVGAAANAYGAPVPSADATGRPAVNSPTTMRSSVVTTNIVETPPSRSRTALWVGAGALTVVLALGVLGAVRFGKSDPPTTGPTTVAGAQRGEPVPAPVAPPPSVAALHPNPPSAPPVVTPEPPRPRVVAPESGVTADAGAAPVHSAAAPPTSRRVTPRGNARQNGGGARRNRPAESGRFEIF